MQGQNHHPHGQQGINPHSRKWRIRQNNPKIVSQYFSPFLPIVELYRVVFRTENIQELRRTCPRCRLVHSEPSSGFFRDGFRRIHGTGQLPKLGRPRCYPLSVLHLRWKGVWKANTNISNKSPKIIKHHSSPSQRIIFEACLVFFMSIRR